MQKLDNLLLANIRRARIDKKWSQDEMAERLHISQNAYSRLESGKSKIDMQRFIEICDLLEITINDMLSNMTGTTYINEQNLTNNKNASGIVHQQTINDAIPQPFYELIKETTQTLMLITSLLQSNISITQKLLAKI